VSKIWINSHRSLAEKIPLGELHLSCDGIQGYLTPLKGSNGRPKFGSIHIALWLKRFRLASSIFLVMASKGI
jgi:hypothetical protein